MFYLKSNVLKSIPTQGGLCRKANSMISWPISRPPWSISQPRWSISGPDGRFPNPMVDFPTLMVNFPTLMVDFLTLMVDFPTLMVRLPTPMVDFPKNAVVTKTFAPKFRSEPSDREVHSSYGDYFRDHFCVCVSGPLSGPTQGPTQGLHKGPSGSWKSYTRLYTSPLHKGSPNTFLIKHSTILCI